MTFLFKHFYITYPKNNFIYFNDILFYLGTLYHLPKITLFYLMTF